MAEIKRRITTTEVVLPPTAPLQEGQVIVTRTTTPKTFEEINKIPLPGMTAAETNALRLKWVAGVLKENKLT